MCFIVRTFTLPFGDLDCPRGSLSCPVPLPDTAFGLSPAPQRGSRHLAGAAWRDVLLRRVSVALRWDPATASPLSSALNSAKKIPVLGGASSVPSARGSLCRAPSVIFKHTFTPDATSTAPLSQVLCRGSAEALSPLSLASLFKRKKDDFSSRRPRSPDSERRAGAVPAHASSPAIKLLQLKCR